MYHHKRQTINKHKIWPYGISKRPELKNFKNSPLN